MRRLLSLTVMSKRKERMDDLLDSSDDLHVEILALLRDAKAFSGTRLNEFAARADLIAAVSEGESTHV